MKKFFCVIVLIFISLISNFSKERKLNLDYRLILDFNSYPYFYEFTNNLNANSFNGSIFFGVKLNEFTIGAEVFENYVSFNSQDMTQNYKGAWNILGSSIDFYYHPVKWFELKSGVGGSCYKSAFNKEESGIYSKNLGGLTFLLDGNFKPKFEYMDFSLINRLDLIFSSINTSPAYVGKIRVNFHPFFNWMNLYLEAGVMTINYSGIPKELNTAAFIWGTGISFDLAMPSIFDYTKDKVYKKNKIPEDNKKEEINLENLKNLKQEESIVFTNIIFFPDKDIIKAESYHVLDKIVDLLKERSNILIEIIGHTNYIGQPENEIELSKKRAEMVMNYFIKKGIDPKRMKASGYGSLFSKKATIEDASRKVEIKILEIL